MDKHGNVIAIEGCTRCHCGAKYWENDKCVSCGGGVEKCYVCKQPMPKDPYGEACDSCMHPEMPREVGDYTDGYGNDYGWQDSTFPNEY